MSQTHAEKIAKYEVRMISEGRCVACGKKRGKSKRYCDHHLLARRIMRRDYNGGKKITEGGRHPGGRPPLILPGI